MKNQKFSGILRFLSYFPYIALYIVSKIPSSGGCGVGCMGNMVGVMVILFGTPILAASLNAIAYITQDKPPSSIRSFELSIFGAIGIFAVILILLAY